MKTLNELNDKKRELVKLFSGWARIKRILQPDQFVEVDIRLLEGQPAIVLKVIQQGTVGIRAMPVSKIKGLSVRATNVLENALINTVGELADKQYSEMRRRRQCGELTIRELAGKLLDLGIEVDWIEKGIERRWYH